MTQGRPGLPAWAWHWRPVARLGRGLHGARLGHLLRLLLGHDNVTLLQGRLVLQTASACAQDWPGARQEQDCTSCLR